MSSSAAGNKNVFYFFVSSSLKSYRKYFIVTLRLSFIHDQFSRLSKAMGYIQGFICTFSRKEMFYFSNVKYWIVYTTEESIQTGLLSIQIDKYKKGSPW